jgi:phosphoribosylformylglycinamidine synthase
LPIAHAEGRFQASPSALADLESDGLVALRYCDAEGNIDAGANPNGSIANIAGIYGGPAKNVFGLMPHPERMSEALLGGTDGRLFFESVVRATAERAGKNGVGSIGSHP